MVCVASGPSAAGVDLTPARGRARLIAINGSWRLAPFADVLYACDPNWWLQRPGHAGGPPAPVEFAGLRVTQDRAAARRHDLARVALVIGGERIVSDQPGILGGGGNSGFQAINLAVQAGAARIVLVGYDFSLEAGVHWHGKHAPGLNNPSAANLKRWAATLDRQAPALRALGVTVVNTSPASALKAFPKATLAEALDGC